MEMPNEANQFMVQNLMIKILIEDMHVQPTGNGR